MPGPGGVTDSLLPADAPVPLSPAISRAASALTHIYVPTLRIPCHSLSAFLLRLFLAV